MVARPEETCAAIRRLITAHPEDALLYAGLVGECGDRIDAETVDALIDQVDVMLAEYLADAEGRGKNALYRPLDLLANLWGPNPLERLQARAGSLFEDRLVTAACRWVENTSGYLDRVFEAAKRILLTISDGGFTRLVNSALSSNSRFAKLDGCKWAPVRPDERTRRLLSGTIAATGNNHALLAQLSTSANSNTMGTPNPSDRRFV